MATVIAYVDGFNLYHGLHQAYGRRFLWLDLQHLVHRVRPHDQILAVRYFTAEVKDDPNGLARQRTYLAALKAYCTKVEVVLGRYQTKTMTCRQCGSAWTSYEEKETDVNIAVALVADAAASASDIARRSSFEIRSLIRKPFTLAVADIRNSLLPESVTDPATGRVHQRPGKWR